MSSERMLRSTSRKLVTLCYHSVAAAGAPYLSVDPGHLEGHLAALRARGYTSGDLGTLKAISDGAPPPGRFALLTFDDGYRDNLTEAMPQLREYGFRAMVFVLPPYLDTGGAFDWIEVAERSRRYPQVMRSMTWHMVDRLAEAGWEVGSHGMRHAHLAALDDDELAQELLDSRRVISERLGRCEVLSYPFGEWNERVVTAARAAGYSFAFALPFGAHSDVRPLCLPRVTIDHRDDSRRFGLKLSPLVRKAMFSQLRPLARWVLRRQPRGYRPPSR